MGLPVDVVVPVKELRHAKTRLAPVVAGLEPGRRAAAHRALAAALIHDTLAAVVAADVRRVVVVTADPDELAGIVPPGVITITDPGGGLNAAVRCGVGHLAADALPGLRGAGHLVAALHADLPALRAAELDEALDDARGVLTAGTARAAFVPDHVDTGTTLLVGGPGGVLDPRFGPGSAAAHRASGAIELGGRWPGLRTDVDTPTDLALAATVGVGPATRAWSHEVSPAAAAGR